PKTGTGPAAGSTLPAGQPLTQQDYWDALCKELGIDCAHWDTSKGLSCNDKNIVPVYEYYARLSDQHPELQWAGMAKLAGGLVYAGMQDLHVLRRLSHSERVRYLAKALSGMPQ